MIPQPYHHHACIDSTSSEAFRLADSGAEHGTVVTADYQTAGRGQQGRQWFMPEGKGILFSVLLRRLPEGLRMEDLPVQTGILVADMLARLSGLKLDIKLPNDLMIGGRKVGGILCEARWKGDEMKSCVIGIGININVPDFPEEITASATSLMRETGREFVVAEVRAELAKVLRGNFQ